MGTKVGNGPLSPNDQLKTETLKQILALGVGGVGLGALYRTMGAAQDAATSDSVAPFKLPNRQVVLPLRYPVQRKVTKPAKILKIAAPGFIDKALQAVGNATGLLNPQNANRGAGGFMAGDAAASAFDMPWAYVAAPAAAAGGLYGGHQLADYLFDTARKKEQQTDLDAAKQDYEQAIQGKTASDLGDVYDTFEKRGWLGGVVGADLLMSTLLAGGAGLGAYNWAKARSPNKVLQKALQQRQQELYARSPRPVVVVPQPFDAESGQDLPPEGEEPKLASVSGMGSAADVVLNKLNTQNQQQATYDMVRLQQNHGAFTQTELDRSKWAAKLHKLQERRDPDGISTEPVDVALRKQAAAPPQHTGAGPKWNDVLRVFMGAPAFKRVHPGTPGTAIPVELLDQYRPPLIKP